jgi:hypothetical protein
MLRPPTRPVLHSRGSQACRPGELCLDGGSWAMDDRAPREASIDPVARRHSGRRLSESANRLSRPDRLLVLDCQGRGCRRRLGQLITRPGRGAVTPDGEILPDPFPDGPVFTIFGPFDTSPDANPDEYRLRGKRESVTAPSVAIPLRRRRLVDDGTSNSVEMALERGVRIVIVCGCGHRNMVNLSALSALGEPARAASDGA